MCNIKGNQIKKKCSTNEDTQSKIPRDMDGQLIREGHQCICLCNTLMNI
jgi:hypothetical protein